jgi:dihydrofolate reductase
MARSEAKPSGGSERVLSIIAAVARNGVIGAKGRLPWHLPAELAHFKRTTMGHPVIMGRKTWESLPAALPGRRNLVLTRTPGYRASGAETFSSLDEALAACGPAADPVVIGGAALFAEALPRAQRIFLTRVHADVPGDTFFPAFRGQDFAEVERVEHPADARHAFAFSIVTLERRR